MKLRYQRKINYAGTSATTAIPSELLSIHRQTKEKNPTHIDFELDAATNTVTITLDNNEEE